MGRNPPTFLPIEVPQKYALHGPSIKFVFNMVMGMGITKTNKDLKISIWWRSIKQNLIRDLELKKFCGYLVDKISSSQNTLTQKQIGRDAWNLRALATLSICQFFRSTHPFCCGVSMQEVSWMIPFSIYKFCIFYL